MCTVGSVLVNPNAGNVIAKSANFTVDIRTRWDNNRREVISQFQSSLNTTCARRGLACEIEVKNDIEAVECTQEVVDALMRATKESESLFMRVQEQQRRNAARQPPAQVPAGTCAAVPDGTGMAECQEFGEEIATERASSPPSSLAVAPVAASAGLPVAMVSGAGHDAMMMAQVAKMGMLFVRCR